MLAIFKQFRQLLKKELYAIILQILSNIFSKRELFSQDDFILADCEVLASMSLGSSASFRRIVSSRDTSTMESEIPSFRDAVPQRAEGIRGLPS